MKLPALGVVATALLTAALAVPITGPVAAAVARVPAAQDASSLPQGARPHRAFLAGVHLTTRTGAHVTVALPVAHASSLALLGNSPRGYVVTDDHSGDMRFYTVAASGAVHLFWTYADVEESSVSWRISHDGTRIAQDDLGRGDGSDVTVFSVAGKQVAHHRFPSYGAGILDFDGSRLVLDVNGIVDWTLGRAPRTIVSTHDVFGSTADIDHDALFLGSYRTHRTSSVSLSHPTRVAWAVTRFSAVDVSPSGQDVVGLTQQGVIQVRSMSTGALVSHDDLTRVDGLVWESDSAYLVLAHGSRGETIARCQVTTQQCRRTTADTSKDLTISTS